MKPMKIILKKHFKLLLIIGVALLLIGAFCMTNTYKNLKAQPLDLEQVKNNPQWLSGKTITGELPDYALKIENAVIKNCTFIDFIARRSTIKNVTFENCQFIKADFYESDLENVVFKGGEMTNLGDPKVEDNLTLFVYSKFKNITIDGTKLSGVDLGGLNGQGGRVILKNLLNTPPPPYGTILGGSNMHLRVDNCRLKGENLANMGKNSTIYATNCEFENSGFLGSKAEVVYIENSKFFKGSWLGMGKTIVVKNSVLRARVGGEFSEKIYLLNNKYLFGPNDVTGIHGSEKTQTYLWGNNEQAGQINIGAGQVTVRDLKIRHLRLQNSPQVQFIAGLNLLNVEIKEGSFFEAFLMGGQWENVTISPPIEVHRAVIENLKVHKVVFPQGPPWVKMKSHSGFPSTFEINVTESPTPFEWPQPQVPTPEELGLNTSLEM